MMLIEAPPRWAAPPHEPVHPRLALVRHRGRLYSLYELLRFVPAEHARPSPDARAAVFQDFWDAFLLEAPGAADRAALQCEPRDFEVLDLYAREARGSA